MLALVLFLILLPPHEIARHEPQRFHVEHITVFATYDAAYALDLANGLLPPDKEVTEADVSCVVNELRSSGLFADIKVEWTEQGKDTRKLALHCESQVGREAFLLSGIVPVGMPEIPRQQFIKQMEAKQIKPGSSLLYSSYNDLNAKLDDWFKESASADAVKKYGETAWITYRPTGPGTIEVRVMPGRPKCTDTPAVKSAR